MWDKESWKIRIKLTEIFPALIAGCLRILINTSGARLFDYVLRACINFMDLNWKIWIQLESFESQLLAVDCSAFSNLFENFCVVFQFPFWKLSGVTMWMFIEDEDSLRDRVWGLNYPFFDRKLIGSEKGYCEMLMMAGILVSRVIISHDIRNMLRCVNRFWGES